MAKPKVVVPLCPGHKRWRPPGVPQVECDFCWARYGRWRHLQESSRGRAKGGGQSSKAKGRSACERVQRALLAAAPFLTEADIFIKTSSQTGVDLHLSPRARDWFKYAIEIKNEERLNVWKALVQAQSNASPDSPPILFFKRAQSELYIALRALDFLALLPWPNDLPAPPPPPTAPSPSEGREVGMSTAPKPLT